MMILFGADKFQARDVYRNSASKKEKKSKKKKSGFFLYLAFIVLILGFLIMIGNYLI